MVITSSGMLFLENNSMIDATSISKKVFLKNLLSFLNPHLAQESPTTSITQIVIKCKLN